MKTFLLGLLALVVAGAGALAWSFTAAPLPVPPGAAVQIPEAQSPPEMRLSVLHAGKMFSQAAFAYRGGALGEARVFGMAGVLVEHPRGALLFDTGFGERVDEHVATISWLMRAVTTYEKETPVAQQLAQSGFDRSRLSGVVLTHAHWDHVSGLDDLREVPVWVTQAELNYITSGDPGAALAASFSDLFYRVYGFPHGPYLGFASSYDVFGDGAVVLVPAPGHTPGSVIAFVTPPGGPRYALVGDLAWQKEGIAIPAERPWLSRGLFDSHPAGVRHWLVHMHQLARLVPDLTLVPAHDRRVLETLPPFGGG